MGNFRFKMERRKAEQDEEKIQKHGERTYNVRIKL